MLRAMLLVGCVDSAAGGFGSALIPEHMGSVNTVVDGKTLDNIKRWTTFESWTTLSNGLKYPRMLSNTADLTANETESALRMASSLGVMGVDFHDNDELDGVAKAVAALGRDAFFLTTKINKPPENVTNTTEAAELARSQFDEDMAKVGIDYLDTLMMKDSPSCPVMQAQWEVVEDLYASGRAKSIGLYNLCEASVRCVLQTAKVKPMVHYVMRHVGMGADMDGLIAFGESEGMKHTVYGTLGEPVALPELLSSPTLKEIAKAHGREVEEVSLKWNLQSGYTVNTRLNSNYDPTDGSTCTNDCIVALTAMTQAFHWSLTSDEMAQIDALNFTAVPQSPTYYSSAGCPASYGETSAQAPTEGACTNSTSVSTWC